MSRNQGGLLGLSGGTEGPGAFGAAGKRAGTGGGVVGEERGLGTPDETPIVRVSDGVGERVARASGVGERERTRGMGGSVLGGGKLGEPGMVVPEHGEHGGHGEASEAGEEGTEGTE